VDEFIKSVHVEAYMPRHVVIGLMTPKLYRGNIENMRRRDEKNRCLDDFLTECNVEHQDIIVRELQENSPSLRSFYDLDVVPDLTDKSILEMVRDGCYILSQCLNMKNIMDHQVAADDLNRFLCTNSEPDIVRDVLFLYENQIPFKVLDTLYTRLVQGRTRPQLKDLMVKWVCEHLQWQKYIRGEPAKNLDFRHLLELVHMIITTSVPTVLLGSSSPDTIWDRATNYEEHAAVTFLYRPLDGACTRSILDVSLGRCGRLHIPPLIIYTDTLPMLRNLMLLEKYNICVNKHVTSYCFFLSKLARCDQDIAFLSKKRIIDNNLQNNNLAATRISEITSGFSPNLPIENYLQKIADALDSRFHSCTYQNISWLKLQKMQNMAMLALSLGGIIIFVCSIIQAVCSIISCPKK
jgi:hypothetical protein